MHFASMGYYESPPRHSHRSPAELAEDEILAALRGVVYPPRKRATTWLEERPTRSATDLVAMPPNHAPE